jgi:hypothetical protein
MPCRVAGSSRDGAAPGNEGSGAGLWQQCEERQDRLVFNGISFNVETPKQRIQTSTSDVSLTHLASPSLPPSLTHSLTHTLSPLPPRAASRAQPQEIAQENNRLLVHTRFKQKYIHIRGRDNLGSALETEHRGNPQDIRSDSVDRVNTRAALPVPHSH